MKSNEALFEKLKADAALTAKLFFRNCRREKFVVPIVDFCFFMDYEVKILMFN